MRAMLTKTLISRPEVMQISANVCRPEVIRLVRMPALPHSYMYAKSRGFHAIDAIVNKA